MKTVDQIIDETIGKEGGYSDHPADRGGPTRWGITQQVARAFGYEGGVAVLPRAMAVQIYRARYWSAPGFDRIAAVSQPIAVKLFDMGVNMGPAVAATFLQRLLNGLNREGGDYADIAADGRIGPMTIAALKALLAKRGAGAVTVVLTGLNGLQAARYVELAEGRPANEAFLYGWLANRIDQVAA
jgi:lysozyme family protein